jgi:hypothetical protein
MEKTHQSSSSRLPASQQPQQQSRNQEKCSEIQVLVDKY